MRCFRRASFQGSTIVGWVAHLRDGVAKGKPSGHLLCGTGTLFSAAQVSGFQGSFPRQKSKSQSSSQAGGTSCAAGTSRGGDGADRDGAGGTSCAVKHLNMGQAFCPPKGNFIFQYLLFRETLLLVLGKVKPFGLIQTMHYYNGNPSRKTIDDSSQNRSPSNFHDHSFSVFSPSNPFHQTIKTNPSKLELRNINDSQNANGFFLGEDDTVDGLATRNPVANSPV